MDSSELPVPARVLLLEDEPLVAQFVVRGLELDGHEVVVAEDEEVGVFLAGTEAFDAIVLDLTSPATSELELLDRIRDAGAGIPIVILSEFDDPEARAAYERAGAATCLAKPLVVDELRAAVSTQLQSRPALPELAAPEVVADEPVIPGESPTR